MMTDDELFALARARLSPEDYARAAAPGAFHMGISLKTVVGSSMSYRPAALPDRPLTEDTPNTPLVRAAAGRNHGNWRPRLRRDMLWDDLPHCRQCEPHLFPSEREGPHHFAERLGDNFRHQKIGVYLDGRSMFEHGQYTDEVLAGPKGEVFVWARGVGLCPKHNEHFVRRIVGVVRVSNEGPDTSEEH